MAELRRRATAEAARKEAEIAEQAPLPAALRLPSKAQDSGHTQASLPPVTEFREPYKGTYTAYTPSPGAELFHTSITSGFFKIVC